MQHYLLSPDSDQFTEEQREAAEEQIIDRQKIADFDIHEYPIEVLVAKFTGQLEYDEAEIFIPDYQREMVWKPSQKSRFIESILLNLPIPYLFFGDTEDGRSEVIDGSQRLRTIVEFMQDSLPLCDLQLLTNLEGFRFKDLPIARQRRLRKKPIRLIEMTENMDEEARRQLFDRLNTGGTKLTTMEQRFGSRDGKFTDFIKDLGEDELFQRLCPISESRKKRREYSELVLRFFAYLYDYKRFEKRVDEFLNNFLDRMNKDGFDPMELSTRFKEMLVFVRDNFTYGFKKDANNNSVPRIRFEAISIGTALALSEKPDLSVDSVNWLFSKEFGSLTRSDASNSRPKVINRLHFVRDNLLGRPVEYMGDAEKIFNDPRKIDFDQPGLF